MIGITPAAFTFMGKYWRAVGVVTPLPAAAACFAYWTGICLTAWVNAIANMVITNKANNSIINATHPAPWFT